MRKSVHTSSYKRFLKHLVATRHAAEVTQEGLARRLKTTQSNISKCERGERRLDIIELRSWLRALNTSLPEFAEELEQKLR